MRNNDPELTGILLGLCSFFVPGLGQLLRGKVFSAVGWFVCTLLGYCCLIIPGLIIHIFCITDAVDSR